VELSRAATKTLDFFSLMAGLTVILSFAAMGGAMLVELVK